MTFKITPHLAAAALAMGLSPVNAQTSGAVTNFSNEPVILAQASNTAGNRPMAKDKFNKMSPKQVSDSIPPFNNQQYKAALERVQPGLADVLDKLDDSIVLGMRHAGSTRPFLVTGTLPNGNDFIHLFQDVQGAASGRTLNFQRKNITSEEEFKKLQVSEGGGGVLERLGQALSGKSEQISANAQWTGPGKYMLNGFIAERQGVQVGIFPADPYAYLAAADFKVDGNNKVVRDPKTGLAIINNLGSPEMQNALGQFDPRWVGLPLDPSRERDTVVRGEKNFVTGPGGQHPGQQPQPGQPTRNGQKIEF